ncbi:methyl-accepting chemotaxis protein [Eleftheria terrae]|uniref:methyl-accepting chemotaxis protein n=1 Tax=Eleftheria terrae TaxID=1597781 RepID=UPI00263ABEBE|nr:methyl-accepting chemotaxis protein [Eleftheria terrae]WKB51388.1 methyl-accepting chemotaxis protein [Eleftheria terrae]
MNLRLKLLLSSAGLGGLGALLAAALLWQGVQDGAQRQAVADLQQALLLQRTAHAAAVQREFATRVAGLRLLAAQRSTVDALRQFKAAMAELSADAGAGTSSAAMREEMLGWLGQQFKPEWARNNLAPLPELTAAMDARALVTAALQQEFIVRNPQPPGRKDLLVYPDTPTPYGQAHAQHHRAFDRAQDQLQVQDLVLIDSDTDQLVYTVAKDLDFASNVHSALLLGSPMATAYAEVRRARSADALALSDARPYLPAANRPVVVAAVPVFDGEVQVGVLAWRASLDQLAAPLRAAPDAAAESLLFGADKRLRSEPRAALLAALPPAAAASPAVDPRALAAHRRSAATLLGLDTPAVAASLQGQSGSASFRDAAGRAWQAAYQPLQLEGQRWALLSVAPEPDAAATTAAGSFWWRALLAMLAALLLGAGVAAALLRGWLKPLGQLHRTLARVQRGELSARTGLGPHDELGRLGQALDRLLDGRLSALDTAARENERLNESVVRLLQTVFQMANKDLSVRAEVGEDLIATLASAVNQLGDEMSATLSEVSAIAARVRSASESVGEQAVRVDETAHAEREALEAMADALNQATYQLAQVGALSHNSSEAAEHASAATEAALAAVDSAVHGTHTLREAIVELEKRFKRLAERSQEISAAVNLMSGIAERTHVLALNAAMQAAGAGEAGRGLALLADEVRRLADSARQATGQIVQLVQGVQVETGDTLLSVNRLIVQVAHQSATTQQAGLQMAGTRETTQHLVGLVRQIAAFSSQQSALAHELKLRVDQLQRGSAHTILAVEQQTESTATLVDFARRLSESVDQFQLPPPPPLPAPEDTIP